MDVRRVEYLWDPDGDYDLEARIDGFGIGHIRCDLQGDRLFIADLLVEETIPRTWPAYPRLLRALLGPRDPWHPRGHGIGQQLLTQLLSKADQDGILETWGNVVSGDLELGNKLLDWYRRNGFVILEPDGECAEGAVKKIVRALSRSAKEKPQHSG